MTNDVDVKRPFWLSDALKYLLTYSGLLAGLGYLFGRAYFQGYFNTLGIDLSFIQLSVYDYIEAGWLFLWKTGFIWTVIISYVLFALVLYNLVAPLFDAWISKHKKVFVLIVVLIWLAFLIWNSWDAVTSFWQLLSFMYRTAVILLLLILFVSLFRFRKSLQSMALRWRDVLRASPKYLDKADRLAHMSNNLLIQGSILLIFLFAYYSSSLDAKDFGSKAAIAYLSDRASEVNIIGSTQEVLDLGLGSTANRQEHLRFLYFNNGHYFLSVLDGNCRPKEVFIINASDITTIRMIDPSKELNCPAP